MSIPSFLRTFSTCFTSIILYVFPQGWIRLFWSCVRLRDHFPILTFKIIFLLTCILSVCLLFTTLLHITATTFNFNSFLLLFELLCWKALSVSGHEIHFCVHILIIAQSGSVRRSGTLIWLLWSKVVVLIFFSLLILGGSLAVRFWIFWLGSLLIDIVTLLDTWSFWRFVRRTWF